MTNPAQRSVDELAAGQIDRVDLAALERIAGLYSQLDPVPDALLDRIQFGLTLDALHAEIAELQRSADLVGVRSEGVTEAQTVTFTSASFTTMVTITALSPEAVRIDGWVVPGNGVGIELRTTGETFVTSADADGRFVFESVGHGLAQFMLRPPADSGLGVVVTPSVEL
jgi:hypothetical protein